MAKNLKLNIKNAQLAEALKLSPPKKLPAKKSAKEAEEAPAASVTEEKSPAVTEKVEPIEIEPTPVLKKEPVASFEAIESHEKAEKVEIQQPASPPPKKVITTSYSARYEAQKAQQESTRRSYGTPGQDRPYFPRKEGGTTYPVKREGTPYPIKREGGTNYP
ncbi:MAG: hypothetical protein JSS09_09620, partial [Verrucomicrobia bacterium]|nr:hypothetical protein [Verrucomicrobiota bacterium]